MNMQPHTIEAWVVATLLGLPGAVRRTFRGGERMLSAAELGVTQVLIERGGAILRSATGTGASAALFGPGCSLGGSYVVEEACEPCLVAIVPTAAILVPFAVYCERLRLNDRLSEWATRTRAIQSGRLLRQLGIRSERDPLRRLASTIEMLATAVGEPCRLARGHILAVPQRDLAFLAGLTRQTVNRELQRLRRSRLLHLERRIVCVLDAGRLTLVARGGPLPPERPLTHCRLLHPADAFDCIADKREA